MLGILSSSIIQGVTNADRTALNVAVEPGSETQRSPLMPSEEVLRTLLGIIKSQAQIIEELRSDIKTLRNEVKDLKQQNSSIIKEKQVLNAKLERAIEVLDGSHEPLMDRIRTLDENLEHLRLAESINKSIDLIERTLLNTKAWVLKLEAEQNDKIRKTLRLVPFFLFSAAFLGFAMGISKNPITK